LEDPKKPWPPRFPPAPSGSEPRTLQDIEKDDWGRPSYDSYLVETCHALRQKPLGTFTVEDLRIMIGQQISLPILVPLALERLEGNPLAEGDFFPGDLLENVLLIDESFWLAHPELHRRACVAAKRGLSAFDERRRLTRSGALAGEDVDPGQVMDVVHGFLARSTLRIT
jgi:CDI immunity proteins